MSPIEPICKADRKITRLLTSASRPKTRKLKTLQNNAISIKIRLMDRKTFKGAKYRAILVISSRNFRVS